MLLTVSIPEWSLDEDNRVIAVGDVFESWLVLVEAERRPHAPGGLQRIHGEATALPGWAGAAWGRYPVRVDTGAAALYWDAPEPVSGPIELSGWVEATNVDAPPAFPATSGTVRRVAMEWSDVDTTGLHERRAMLETAWYAEVPASRLVRRDLHAAGPLLTAVLIDLEVAPRGSS